MILIIKLPRGAELDFRPGQYVDLTTREGVRRSYSIAQASGRGDCLEFHIRHCPGGRFTDGLFNEREPLPGAGHIVRVEGPYGNTWLREADAPVILLASGTGFAPIKAMVEEAMRLGIRRPMRLYWGGRRPADLYMDGLCRRWAATWEDFSYIPVVSDACVADAWKGRTGWVHRAVMEDIGDLAAYHVYACGAPVVWRAPDRTSPVSAACRAAGSLPMRSLRRRICQTGCAPRLDGGLSKRMTRSLQERCREFRSHWGADRPLSRLARHHARFGVVRLGRCYQAAQ